MSSDSAWPPRGHARLRAHAARRRRHRARPDAAPHRSPRPLPVTGTAKTARSSRARTRSTASPQDGKLFAVGTLAARSRASRRQAGRQACRQDPDHVAAGSAQAAQVLPPIPNTCQVLNLVLGPINLNLLGLVVRTNQIDVRIDAVPGAGNLLGNLLCGDHQPAEPRQPLGARRWAS